MRDEMSVGPSPADEECVQLGAPNYMSRARDECNLFKEVIIQALGDPPPGARLAVKGFPHDFGTYYEVVVVWEDSSKKATEYAYKVEGESPLSWPPIVKELLARDVPIPEIIRQMKGAYKAKPMTLGAVLQSKKKYGLAELLAEYDMDVVQMAEQSLMDGTCPGICYRCGHTIEIEPDSGSGWCEVCEENTVMSGMRLAGMI